jgi:hypothetical protein
MVAESDGLSEVKPPPFSFVSWSED